MARARWRSSLALLVTLAAPWTAADTPLSIPQPVGPRDQVTVVDGRAETEVVLSWKDVPGAVRYRVQVSPQPEFPEAAVQAAGTSYTARGLAPGVHF